MSNSVLGIEKYLEEEKISLQAPPLENDNGWETVQAIKYTVWPAKEHCNNNVIFDSTVVTILIRKKPFSQGSRRYATLVKEHDKYYVAKEFKYENKYIDLQSQWKRINVQLKAREICAAYNKALFAKGIRTNFVDYAPPFMYNIPSRPESRRYMQAEPLLNGTACFEKYNVDNGFVMPGNYATVNTFTHFSLQHSENELAVLDVQGVGSLLTDPKISIFDTTNEYGNENFGEEAFTTFLVHHTCNQLCKTLELEKYCEEPYKNQKEAVENKLFCTFCHDIIDLGYPVTSLPPFPYTCDKCNKKLRVMPQSPYADMKFCFFQ